MSDIIERAKNIHGSIAGDVWPNGWRGKCHKCGKPFYYTRTECAFYLAHGWPVCDHKPVKRASRHNKGEPHVS